MSNNVRAAPLVMYLVEGSARGVLVERLPPGNNYVDGFYFTDKEHNYEWTGTAHVFEDLDRKWVQIILPSGASKSLFLGCSGIDWAKHIKTWLAGYYGARSLEAEFRAYFKRRQDAER